jgi:truncated hemoglobin YjbI
VNNYTAAALIVAAILAVALLITHRLAAWLARRDQRRYRRGQQLPGRPPAEPVAPPLPSRSAVPPMPEEPLPPRPLPREDVAAELAAELRANRAAFVPDQIKDRGTIYERYKGRPTFRAIVHQFYDRTAGPDAACNDPQWRAQRHDFPLDLALAGPGGPFYGMAQERRQRLEGHLTNMLMQITDAPSEIARASYEAMVTGSPGRGRPARNVGEILARCHGPLNLTDDVFDRAVRHLVATLQEFGVDEADIITLGQRIEDTRPHVVSVPPASLNHPPL